MPGVPSGRGCDACRKQKKKCDQGTPACARCSRLQIKCIGSGQRRFKFKEQAIVLDPVTGNKAVVHRTHQRTPSSAVLKWNHRPSNDSTRLTDAFVALLRVRDPRYSMSVYGMFIYDTPRLVGSSKALDASIKALTVVHPILFTRQQSVLALSTWIHALAALRGALQDPKQATSIETLIAIYYVFICQLWLGKSYEDHSNHAEGMSYILNSMVRKDLKSKFETRMFVTLTASVVFESFLTPHLEVNPIVWEAMTTYNVPTPINSGQGNPLKMLELSNLIEYSRVLRAVKPDYDEARFMYSHLRVETLRFGQHLEYAKDPNSDKYIADEEHRCHLHAAYGLGVGLSLMFNLILRAYDDLDPELLEDAHVFVESCVALARYEAQFMPLGSSWMNVCLIPAWVATTDASQRAEVELEINLYDSISVPYESRWVEKSYWLQKRLEKLRFTVLAARSEASSEYVGLEPTLEDMPEEIQPPPPEGCIVC